MVFICVVHFICDLVNYTLGGTTTDLILTTICTFVSIMPVNLGNFASSMWMSLFFGLGTVVNIKKIKEWPLKIKYSIIICQVLGAILFLNIINENAITSRFFFSIGNCYKHRGY